MKKIKEMFEDYNTKKMAKKHGRTIDQQEYRKIVAKKVNDMRQYGSDLAKTLLEKEKGTIQYVESLGKGRKAGKDVAEQLIKSGQLDYVVDNLKKFEGSAHNTVANALIEQGKYKAVAHYLYSKKFRGLNKDVAIKLIENKEGVAVLRNFDCFKGLDKDVIQAKIKFGGLGELETLDGIEGLDRKTAEMMVDVGEFRPIFKYLDKFEGLVLDKNMAVKMIEVSRGHSGRNFQVPQNLDKFEGLDHKEIAEKLIERGEGRYVAENLEKFEGLDHKEIVEKMIEKGQFKYVATNLEKFQGLSNEERREVTRIVTKEIPCDELLKDKYKGLDQPEVLKKLIKEGYIKEAMNCINSDKFEGVLDKNIANILIENGYGDIVAKYLEKFGLKKEK